MTKRKDDDLLLGKIAVASRMVTEAHVKRCVEIQSREDPKRPLGQILVEEDYLTIGQLDHLIKTQAERFLKIDRKSQVDPRESLFGRMAHLHGFITKEQLNESLREQANIARLKIFFRLGEILIKKGFMSPEQVRKVLDLQQKKILHCPRCGSRYNITSFDDDAKLQCKKCESRLILSPEDESVMVKETLRMEGGQFKAMKDQILGKKKDD